MGLLDGVLPAIYSAGNTAKRRLNGLLADPAGTMGLGVTRFAEDNNNLLNTMANAYPMAGDKTVLNTPKQNALARALCAGKGTDMAMAVMTTSKFVYPQDAALAKAQANAALPIEKGGLGLGPNNAAAERAKAMGFEDDVFHGTNADIKAFDPLLSDTRRKTGTPSGAMVVSNNPATASTYAGEVTDQWGNVKQYLDDGNVMPLNISKGKNMAFNANGENWNSLFAKRYPEAESTNDLAEIALSKGKDSATIKKVLDNATWSKKNGVDSRIGDSTFIFNPANIRSRFAAFDPMRRNEADLLGRADPNLLAALAGGGLLGLGGYKAMSGDKK